MECTRQHLLGVEVRDAQLGHEEDVNFIDVGAATLKTFVEVVDQHCLYEWLDNKQVVGCQLQGGYISSIAIWECYFSQSLSLSQVYKVDHIPMTVGEVGHDVVSAQCMGGHEECSSKEL